MTDRQQDDCGEKALDHQGCTSRRFVVQLRVDADATRGVHRGRVQHIRSGEAAHFDSLDELAAFFARASKTAR